MNRLLSDIDGKIKHVLLCLAGSHDIQRIVAIVKAFDKDVEITIACHRAFGEQLSSRTRAVVKRLLRRNLSERDLLALSLPSGRTIHLLSMDEDPWIWAQDLVHISENKILSPSIAETERSLSEIGKLSQKTSSELLKQQFWIDHEFTVTGATELGLGNSDGGNLIACGETVFVGDGMIGQHLKHKMGQKNGHVKQETYERAEGNVLRGLKELEGERRLCVLPFQADHLDMAFTPISENSFVLADVSQAIEALRLPPHVSIQGSYRKYASALEKLASAISLKWPSARVARIPCVPPLMCDGRPLNHSTSYNNILQENFRSADGIVKHRAYVPMYSHSSALFQHIDPANWFGLQKSAIDIYRGIGLEVRIVPLLLEPVRHVGGGLRCSVKVLEREL